MATLAELIALRAALETARYSGQKRVKTGTTEIDFKTDAELKAALVDLGQQIIAAGGSSRIAVIQINSSKGL